MNRIATASTTLALASGLVVGAAAPAGAVGYGAVPGVTSGTAVPDAGPTPVALRTQAADTGSGSLPFTGGDIGLVLGGGLLLLGAGGALRLLARGDRTE